MELRQYWSGRTGTFGCASRNSKMVDTIIYMQGKYIACGRVLRTPRQARCGCVQCPQNVDITLYSKCTVLYRMRDELCSYLPSKRSTIQCMHGNCSDNILRTVWVHSKVVYNNVEKPLHRETWIYSWWLFDNDIWLIVDIPALNHCGIK